MDDKGYPRLNGWETTVQKPRDNQKRKKWTNKNKIGQAIKVR